MEPNLTDLETLARQAGKILRDGFIRRPGFDQALAVEYKSLIDPVTEVDRRSDAFLIGEIQRLFPTHRVISEESGTLTGQDCCVWYIDPLDGTVNFAHSVPIFSVSIAYTAGGVTQLGVVYDPMQDECFSAERGRGAWLNGEPICVSAVQELDRCLFVTGFPYDIRTRAENNLDNFAYFSLLSQGVRRLGSAALDLCYVAAGRIDGFWEVSIKAWDVAAGGLIAREAGAIVTD
ncbi:MAG TPA: inositol monophosphatase family protein, partial [Anaerolineales bacterium]